MLSIQFYNADNIFKYLNLQIPINNPLPFDKALDAALVAERAHLIRDLSDYETAKENFIWIANRASDVFEANYLPILNYHYFLTNPEVLGPDLRDERARKAFLSVRDFAIRAIAAGKLLEYILPETSQMDDYSEVEKVNSLKAYLEINGISQESLSLDLSFIRQKDSEMLRLMFN